MASSRTKPGRPPKGGPRYDCGRRKPTGDPRGNRDWQFIREHGKRLGADAKLSTEIGRLAFDGQLTDTQVEAAFLVGRVYGEFRQFKRKRSSPASPGYLRCFGDPDGQEDEENPSAEPLIDEHDRQREETALERRSRRAERRFEKLTECFGALPPGPAQRVRKAIEALCVEDRFITAAEIEEAAPMLDWIASKFGLAAAPPTSSIAIRGRSARRAAPQHVRDRRVELDKQAWLKCTRALRKDLSEAQLETAWRTFQQLCAAERDRERFRRDKEKGR